MNNAVIYARFSSHGQNEQTIESQIRICKEYAQKQGLNVIRIYDADKAKSASKETHKRRDLHKMFADAETKTFQYIIVYKLNRFARNRNESRIFKSELERHGVRVLSATEHITDDEGGELYEMILEWNDEKYSQRLSKNILDGIDTSVENGTYTGGTIIYGYKLIDSGLRGRKDSVIHKVAIDDEQAELVKFAFNEYAKGTSKKDIADILNNRGIRINGKLFKGRTFDKWFSNEKYTGVFTLGGRTVSNMYPALIDKLLFNKVQGRLKQNAYFSGANSAKELYLLTGKLRCGHCESLMTADKGKSRLGIIYSYYACKKMRIKMEVPECIKKRENKENLEKDVVEIVVKYLRKPENANRAAEDTVNYYEKRTGLDNIKSIDMRIIKIRQEVNELADAFVKAKSALLQNTIENKISDFETILADLQEQKTKLELERGLQLTKKDILDFISTIIAGNSNDKEYRQKIINHLIKVIYVSDNDMITAWLSLSDEKEMGIVSLDNTNKVLNDTFGMKMGQYLCSSLIPSAQPYKN